jgi:ABC-2 type transport system ATP-binding protein
MIEAINLSKRYGSKLAVDDMTFTVAPGKVTGFLGPNGAGKSTTMRLLLGLDAPTNGRALINGRPYVDLERPLAEVGVLLEARAVHTGRSARNHLLAIAATAGISTRRVDEVIDLVGLSHVAKKRVGSFSLGMGQRLGIASALLANPKVLILDEPINGLDPDGIKWIRNLLRSLAAEGKTVFLSSHLMSEMALTADHVIVVGQGRLLRDEPMSTLISQESKAVVNVRTPQVDKLVELLRSSGVKTKTVVGTSFVAEGMISDEIGTMASNAGITLYELATQTASLEEAYMAITQDVREFSSSAETMKVKA